jgi:DMSO/TMAO reductase YedYZ molybdopterin-dependent catalytic subunit
MSEGRLRRRERGLRELYAEDPTLADEIVFGRRAYADRRGFLGGAGLAAMGAVLGAAIPFHRHMPAGLIPAALADTAKEFAIEGKDGLTVLNDRPLNAETPAHLLDDAVTPIERHFIRNNGIAPENTSPEGWKLTIDGEVENPIELTIDELRSRFEPVTLQLQIECAGNGRAAFNPPARGNQWTVGAIGCSQWTGVRLKDVLEEAKVRRSAVYTAHRGADSHLSGDPSKLALSRGMPITKAMSPYNLIAVEMNGQPIHAENGAPLRLVVPGWPGSCSQKWLTGITLRNQEHDGPGMTGMSYRMPAHPVAPGADVPASDMEVIHSMPVKSIITFPENEAEIRVSEPLEVRGHAWAGDNGVLRLDLTYDFGRTWQQAELKAPVNPFAWQNWQAKLQLPEPGYYEIWARATDDQNREQPFAVAWNPRGYLNNSLHRVAVRAA